MERPGEQKKGQRGNIKTWAMEKESNVDGATKTLVGGGWLWAEIVLSGSSLLQWRMGLG